MSIEATILDNGISANIATAAVSATFTGGINIDVDTLALAASGGAGLVGYGESTVGASLPETPEKHGAAGDGVTDDAAAMQAAFDAVPDGGTLLLRNDYALKSAVSVSGKRLTLKIEGQILDRCTTWTKSFADLTATGKGLICFLDCDVAIIGQGATHLDGGNAVSGVDQTTRIMLYFYDCDSVYIDGVNSIKGTHAAVGTFKCRNITHRNCLHDDGEFPALHSRSTDLLVDNVRVTNGLYNGILVSNRGEFSGAVLAEQRGLRITITNSSTYNITSPNSYAVGITVDSCDYFTASGNDVDGNAVGTMAYSWAGSTRGRIFGNDARNMSNTANGTDTYAGIGHELDTVSDIECFGNTFDEVLIAHLIIDANRVRVDGVSTCDTTRESNTSTGAGRSAFAALQNSASGTSSDITISGVADGHTVAIEITSLAEINGLTIRGFVARDQFFRVLNGVAGAIVTRFTLDGLRVEEPGPAKTVLNWGDNVLKDAVIRGVAAKAASAPASNQRFFYGEALAANYSFSDIEFENYDVGIVADHYNRVTSVTVNNMRARGVAGSLISVTGASVKVKGENITLNGTAVAPTGNQASILAGSTTYDPPILATGAQQSTTVTVTGAAIGDVANVSFSLSLSGTRMWGEVTAANTVTVYHRNDTGGTVDLASGTLRAKVIKA